MGFFVFQFCGDRFDDVPDVGFVGVDVDGDVRVLLVESGAFVVDVAEGLSLRDDDAAGCKVPDALLDRLIGSFQVHDGADLPEVLHGAGPVDRRAAGRDDRVVRDERRVDRVLKRGECLRPHLVDHVLQFTSGLFLDDEVRVQEPVSQVLREQDADRALSATRHADEDDVVFHCLVLRSLKNVIMKCDISLSNDDSLVKLQIF